MRNTRRIGTHYEAVAARELERRGCRILDRNYRCPSGEIDLVARQDDTIIFAEVKYRAADGRGCPEEAVDARKQRRISRAALWYLAERNISDDMTVRFDVIAVTPEETVVYENAFDYRG